MRPLRAAVRARSRARAAVSRHGAWVAARADPSAETRHPRDRARVPTCDERGERRARGADDVTRDRHVRK